MERRSLSSWMFDVVDKVGNIGRAWEPELVTRARVVIGMCLLVFILVPPAMISSVVLGSPPLGLWVVILVLCAHVGALVLIRRGQITAPSAILPMALNISLLIFGAHQDGLPVFIHPIMLVPPCLAIYLLGSRRGVVFTIAVVLEIVGGYALHASGNALQASLLPPD